MSIMNNYADFRDAIARFEGRRTDFEFGTVFKRDGDWLVEDTDSDRTVGYTESGIVVEADADGGVSDEAELEALREHGYGAWEPVSGYSGQHGYRGPSMHVSEQFAGNMAAAIWQDAEPGDRFVMIYLETEAVDDDDQVLERDGYGWMLLKRTIGTEGEG